jgi:BolA protein
MSVSETIKKKLISQFKPTNLEIIDESHLHSGHVGAKPEGETHFRLIISSENFIGKTRIEKQRQIYKALKQELAGPIHALSIQAD